jgi:hypothetical protein
MGMFPPGKSVKPSARQVMQSLTLLAHRPVWGTPDLSNFPSEATLTACVNHYLSHFATWLPIVDSPKGSFQIDKAAPILLKAMAAIGSVFMRDGTEQLGLPLAELVRREIIFIVSRLINGLLRNQTEHDQRFAYDLGVVQASLLQSCFGLYSGSPKHLQQAEVNRANLVSAARRMQLLKSGISAQSHVASTGGSLDDYERAAKQDHRRRRLGWCIFVSKFVPQ